MAYPDGIKFDDRLMPRDGQTNPRMTNVMTEETTRLMKRYVRIRMNHLMRLGQENLEGDNGSVECDFRRLEAWDKEKFNEDIESICEDALEWLNSSNSPYEFSVESCPNDEMEWNVSICWDVNLDINPFVKWDALDYE